MNLYAIQFPGCEVEFATAKDHLDIDDQIAKYLRLFPGRGFPEVYVVAEGMTRLCVPLTRLGGESDATED